MSSPVLSCSASRRRALSSPALVIASSFPLRLDTAANWPDGIRPGERTPLSPETIPTEILLCITDNLLPEERAALALASHTMLRRLGKRSLQLGPVARFKLYLLLHLPYIYCRFCQVSHALHPIPGRRPCEMPPNAGPGYLLPQINFNTVAALVACSRYRSPLFEVGMFNTKCKVKLGTEGEIHSYHDFRVINGHLLYRRQHIFFPYRSKQGTREALPSAEQMPQMCLHDFGDFCPHRRWKVVPWGAKAKGNGVPCWCLQVDHDISDHYAMHEVSGCLFCRTDCSLGVLRLPNEGGSQLVLTIWKDLGPGETPDDPEWPSHCGLWWGRSNAIMPFKVTAFPLFEGKGNGEREYFPSPR